MEGGGGCFLRIVMENVFRGLDCDGKQRKSAPRRRQEIHVAPALQGYKQPEFVVLYSNILFQI